MTIHPFPRIPREAGLVRLARPPAPDGNGTTVGAQHACRIESSGPRYGLSSRGSVMGPNSAGIVHAIEPSGRAEAIPASFSFFSAFNDNEDTQDNLGQARMVVTKLVECRPQCGDLLSRAEQIRVAAILAERATADLLARAVQLRNSLTPHGDQSTMMELQRASKSLRESSNHVFA